MRPTRVGVPASGSMRPRIRSIAVATTIDSPVPWSASTMISTQVRSRRNPLTALNPTTITKPSPSSASNFSSGSVAP